MINDWINILISCYKQPIQGKFHYFVFLLEMPCELWFFDWNLNNPKKGNVHISTTPTKRKRRKNSRRSKKIECEFLFHLKNSTSKGKIIKFASMRPLTWIWEILFKGKTAFNTIVLRFDVCFFFCLLCRSWYFFTFYSTNYKQFNSIWMRTTQQQKEHYLININVTLTIEYMHFRFIYRNTERRVYAMHKSKTLIYPKSEQVTR